LEIGQQGASTAGFLQRVKGEEGGRPGREQRAGGVPKEGETWKSERKPKKDLGRTPNKERVSVFYKNSSECWGEQKGT